MLFENTMRVLLTGGYGCLGSWIARYLLQRGDDVFVYDLKQDPKRMRLIMPAEHAGVPRLSRRERWMIGGVLGAVVALAIALVISFSTGAPSSGNGCIYATVPGVVGAEQGHVLVRVGPNDLGPQHLLLRQAGVEDQGDGAAGADLVDDMLVGQEQAAAALHRSREV